MRGLQTRQPPPSLAPRAFVWAELGWGPACFIPALKGAAIIMLLVILSLFLLGQEKRCGRRLTQAGRLSWLPAPSLTIPLNRIYSKSRFPLVGCLPLGTLDLWHLPLTSPPLSSPAFRRSSAPVQPGEGEPLFSGSKAGPRVGTESVPEGLLMCHAGHLGGLLVFCCLSEGRKEGRWAWAEL